MKIVGTPPKNHQYQGKIFYTTGRLTSEMVIKVAQMNISTLLSRSGITEMGLNVAIETQVTLLGRAKGKHFLVYNGKDNIIFDATYIRLNFCYFSISSLFLFKLSRNNFLFFLFNASMLGK